jgi:hypothetical protein
MVFYTIARLDKLGEALRGIFFLTILRIFENSFSFDYIHKKEILNCKYNTCISNIMTKRIHVSPIRSKAS